jgi:hypothetical protein
MHGVMHNGVVFRCLLRDSHTDVHFCIWHRLSSPSRQARFPCIADIDFGLVESTFCRRLSVLVYGLW